MTDRPTIDYEPGATSPSPGVSVAFIGVALGAMSALWATVAIAFDLFWSQAIVPVPVQAWMLSAGVLPSAAVGLAIGLRRSGTTFGRLAVVLSLPSLVVSLFLLALAWFGRY